MAQPASQPSQLAANITEIVKFYHEHFTEEVQSAPLSAVKLGDNGSWTWYEYQCLWTELSEEQCAMWENRFLRDTFSRFWGKEVVRRLIWEHLYCGHYKECHRDTLKVIFVTLQENTEGMHNWIAQKLAEDISCDVRHYARTHDDLKLADLFFTTKDLDLDTDFDLTAFVVSVLYEFDYPSTRGWIALLKLKQSMRLLYADQDALIEIAD